VPSVLATAFVKIEAIGANLGKEIQAETAKGAAGAGAAGAKAGDSWAKGFQNSKLVKVSGMISLAMAGAAVASVKMAATFDAQMTRLSTQAGVAAPKLAGLRQGVLDLAGKVGFSPDSLAVSLYHVESNFESLGITSAKALGIVKTAAEGAAVGGANLEDVTNALTASVAAGIPGVQNMQQAMGVLNATVGVGDMKMQDLADAFGTGMVAVVKGYGLSIKDVGAALAVFGDNNIRGAQAGTELRMAVQALAVPAKAGAKELQSIGLNAASFAKTMQSGGLLPAVEQLVTHMREAGISAKQQGDVITQIFGKKAGTGIAILAGQLDRLQSKYPALTKAADGFADAWKRTQQTPAQKWKELEARAQSLAIAIGVKLMPYVIKLMAALSEHWKGIAQTALAIGAVAVAVKGLNLAIAAIAILTDPVALLVIGIAALAFGIYKAYDTSSKFRNIIKDIGIVMLGVAGGVVLGAKFIMDAILLLVSSVIDSLAKVFGWVPGIGPKLRSAAKAFDGFRASADNAFNGVLGKLNEWTQALEKSKEPAAKQTTAILKEFQNQAKGADTARAALDKYTTALSEGWAGSAASKAARKSLLSDLEQAGVDANTARTDVNRYTTAVQQNGSHSEEAHKARLQLIYDIESAAGNARQGHADLDKYNQTIKRNGADSDAAKKARQQVITDLENAGINAQTARRLVDDLTTAYGKVPKHVYTDMTYTAAGNWSIKQIFPGSPGPGNASRATGIWTGATGGKIPGFGGGDIIPALLEPGETVVDKQRTKGLAGLFKAIGVPGFLTGSYVGSSPPGLGNWTVKEDKAQNNQVAEALKNAVLAGIAAARAATGSGSAIAEFAQSFVGKVPYVWGGTSPSGWDCSGMVEYVYNHFHLYPPRTSQDQWNWVNRKKGPTTGGLAFFVGSGDGGSVSAPGHVGIVISPSQMVNAEAPGLGTQVAGLGGAVGFGTPPGGFGGGGGAVPAGAMSAQDVAKLWVAAGGPGGQYANIAQAITGAESARRPSAVQQGQPYSTTGWGLWQITPGNSVPSVGVNQALLIPMNNARAAVYKFHAADGFSPWTTYESGAYKPYLMDKGGTLPPGLSLVKNNTGKPEHLTPADGGGDGASLDDVCGLLSALISVAAAAPGSTAAGITGALGGAARTAGYSAMYR